MNFFNKIKTRVNLVKNNRKKIRKLEIGPGTSRINGFETLNIINSNSTDYILDASMKLPFTSNTFEIVYASHILEHIPWYKTRDVLVEWKRIIKPEGWIEIWVPDGLKIAKAFVEAEKGNDYLHEDGWFKFNNSHDPCLWASGRIFTYGDGLGETNHPNWHRAIFSERYLIDVLAEIGFNNVTVMTGNEVRGYDHKWINLGVKGQKK